VAGPAGLHEAGKQVRIGTRSRRALEEADERIARPSKLHFVVRVIVQHHREIGVELERALQGCIGAVETMLPSPSRPVTL
jgi:hypothetical protein